ncbi:Uma2 family endonuclease [Cohnella thailandensis]|uniref:Uma2 family endonuclease n=1 Tax=Cohnella thailandensis TaxID=557557 RepID=A0A841T4P7_9BACL|nr:Uma2 family endonuclease [Cohnella thailandensis]MBB6636827.1 Uma2 family endonuclease [Cohnella thailandensis]MBP1973296.1 Uma2 family endonuclease [Cohnella thailandensis]
MDSKKKEPDRVREGQVTYEIYAEMPDDGQRYEIIDGVLEMMTPGPSTSHQSIGGEMEYILKLSCKPDYIILRAPLDVILSKTNVLQPDLLMIHRSRISIVSERGIEGAPDLVAEILSPSSRKRDRVVKSKVYAKHGVPEYWIVDAATKTLEQYRLADSGHYELLNLFNGEDTVVSDKLPCVSFRLSDIFQDIWQ